MVQNYQHHKILKENICYIPELKIHFQRQQQNNNRFNFEGGNVGGANDQSLSYCLGTSAVRVALQPEG